MITKGIILAGGAGTRLHPMTRVMSKHLLPVYDKPMIYYSLTTLMLAGLREILVITTPIDQPLYQRLLGTGEQWGIRLSYCTQPSPDGLAQALLLAEDFLAGEGCALILGDNIFYADRLTSLLGKIAQREEGATIFAYNVKNPERYGVIEFDEHAKPIRLVEKPQRPPSSYAVTGLYFYDGRAPEFARMLTPSARGELEITDLNMLYLQQDALHVEILGRGVAWLDTGTPESLLDAAKFIETLENRQGLKIGCVEEVAYRQGFISADQLAQLAADCGNPYYGQYLLNIIQGPYTPAALV